MKRLFFIPLLLLGYIQYGYSQEIHESTIMLDKNTIIKDDSGNKVEVSEFMELMRSGEWAMDAVKDSEGKLQYIQLRKATEEEKKRKAQMPSRENSSDLIGKRSPDFIMVDINGNTISSENTKGKVVVLNFWFAACKPCISEIPELNEVYEKYINDTNVVFASVTFDKLDKVNLFLKKYPIKYPVVSDAKEICNLFNIMGYPTNIVIDKNGNYFSHTVGGFPQIGHQISNSIQNALENKKPGTNPMSSGRKMINPNSTFKLEDGKVIPFEKVIELMKSNNYDMTPQKDQNNKEYYLLKKKN